MKAGDTVYKFFNDVVYRLEVVEFDARCGDVFVRDATEGKCRDSRVWPEFSDELFLSAADAIESQIDLYRDHIRHMLGEIRRLRNMLRDV